MDGGLATGWRLRGDDRATDGGERRRLRAVGRLGRGRASGVRLDSCLRRNDGKGCRSGGKGAPEVGGKGAQEVDGKGAQEWRKGGAGE